ncbi:hypothetical protein [Kitasatospora cinereorecta]
MAEHLLDALPAGTCDFLVQLDEPPRDVGGVEQFSVPAGDGPSGLHPGAPPRLAVLVLLGASRAMVRAPATVWIVLVHLPAIHELLGEREEPGVQVRVGPPLTACLTTPQPPEVDQVKQRVRAVLGFTVEEAAGVLRRPGHHRRGLLADSLPVEDALLGPYKRLGIRFPSRVGRGEALRVINCRPIAVFNAARGVERTRGNAEASCR